MKISIITVSFNSESTIEDTLKCVSEQEYEHIEHIIVDGGSTDGTIDLIKSYETERLKWISEPDKGLYNAMNKGIKMATGEVIGILNSDDFYSDSAVIKDIMRAFDDKELCQCVYADLDYVDEMDTQKVRRKWRTGLMKANSWLNGWMPPHPTFFTLKECYEKYGSYNEDLTTSADYELMLRFLYKNGLSSAYVSRTIVKMRTGGQSNASVSNRIKANQEDRIAWEINELKPRFYTFVMKPLRKLTQFL